MYFVLTECIKQLSIYHHAPIISVVDTVHSLACSAPFPLSLNCIFVRACVCVCVCVSTCERACVWGAGVGGGGFVCMQEIGIEHAM